ncbi:MAG: hypothetical protein J2P52_12490 [Blastocatellia bacterium]|nr:hypothetical protein [Blastocatellia bacterium]
MEKIFWLFCLLVTVLNAYSLKRGARKLIAERPELEEGYEKLVNGYLFFGSLPWVVMGIGILSGSVHGFFDYFRPREGNPFVLAFHAVIIAIWALTVNWIYFGSGAEFLVNHPGLFNLDFKSPTGVKIMTAISLAGGVVGMYLMWSINVPSRQLAQPR